MRTLRTTRSRGFQPVAMLPDSLREALARRAVELGGLTLVGLGALAAVALATWSVQDPSLSHATDAPIHNMVGPAGAVVADLLTQLFGLAAAFFVLPVAIWGWRLLTHRAIEREKLKLAAWPISAALLAGFVGFFPASPGWPLPTGLGGVLGDLFTMAADAIGFTSGVARIGAAAMLGLAGLGAFAVAIGLIGPDDAAEDLAPAPRRDGRTEPVLTHAPRRPAPQVAPQAQDDYDDGEDDDRRLVSLGLLVHWGLSARAALGRAVSRRGPASSDDERALSRILERAAAAEDRDAEGPVALRREPGFDRRDAPDERGRREPVLAPSVLGGAPQQLAGAERPAGRVAPVPAAPRPGRRMAREAQPDLLDRDGYELPPLTLLAEPKKSVAPQASAESLEQNARMLEEVLQDYGVRGAIINVKPGPVVTLYELEPAPGIKSSRVIGLADDIARSMSAVAARVAVIPGRNVIGIELPNARRETVYLRELLASADFEKAKMRLPLCLGKTIGGEPVIAELARMPHLLIAGTTGSGKSVAINTMIMSLLYRLKPEECRLIMIDPKMLELSIYEGIPHLLTPVVTDPKKAVTALKWAVREMEDRYRKMSKLGVRNIDGFNARAEQALAKGEAITRTVQTGFDKDTGEAVYEQEVMEIGKLPYIVVIVDEMADLMLVAGKEIEGAIQRLAQMARAAGIHIVMATQRPSVDVITGTIKANFPTRISFQVTSKIDSRTILGEMGAEQLLGQGDMLHMAGGGRISRVHGPYCSDQEVEDIVAHLKRQGRPDYLDAVLADEDGETGEDGAVLDKGSFGDEGGDVYDQAVQVVLRDKKCSTSYIQRRLQIGYNRAASLVERMEKEGVVGPANHAGKREILLATEDRDDDAA
ncbi:DNA translocase FtsK [Methylopila jiangsuensis]|uniref:DNA translocase FtsK n=1 Tax=Methylopila jiangsuensis TaxID=586230 RepID=A0A9W6JFP7_9HYPH|nr:DNA translocase FtsK [Methylopila jiangsuensis]MDR6287424.1 S-DNA-T family DNA segregation ATPase FtsK/SpoIIIE [Methylopila jiangsuensis]GLK75005.1 DNA translocase FtsK [Methylopila jiangsuensis]